MPLTAAAPLRSADTPRIANAHEAEIL